MEGIMGVESIDWAVPSVWLDGTIVDSSVYRAGYVLKLGITLIDSSVYRAGYVLKLGITSIDSMGTHET